MLDAWVFWARIWPEAVSIHAWQGKRLSSSAKDADALDARVLVGMAEEALLLPMPEVLCGILLWCPSKKRDAFTCVQQRAPRRAHNEDTFNAPQLGHISSAVSLVRNFLGFGADSGGSYAKWIVVMFVGSGWV